MALEKGVVALAIAKSKGKLRECRRNQAMLQRILQEQ